MCYDILMTGGGRLGRDEVVLLVSSFFFLGTFYIIDTMYKTFKTIEEEIQTFSEQELHIWNKGYLAAIEGLLEQIQEDQIRILNKLVLVEGDNNKRKTQALLQSRLVMLDLYEVHFRNRMSQLTRDAE